MSRSPEYRAYIDAHNRCKYREDYIKRGTKFLFQTFEDWFKELGARPSSKHSVDRINNLGNYEVGNVRWATKGEQNSNKEIYAHKKRTGKGYSWSPANNKWIVQIRYKRKQHYVGYFVTEAEAKEAHAAALKELESKQ
jgi:hypothetical protein